jgi:nucleolar protein 9
MPRVERKGRANKKRGKKGGKKETPEEDTQEAVAITPGVESMDITSTPNTHAGPAGIVFNDQHFQAAHFGEVDEELLGYFKNVEQTLDDPQFETGEGTLLLKFEAKKKCQKLIQL